MTTDQRIEKMEGQLARVRWSNRLLITCIVLSLGIWFILKTFEPGTALAASGGKTIFAKQFVLEDEKGKPRVILGFGAKGPGLYMWDENEKLSAILAMQKENSGLMLYDDNGKLRLMLTLISNKPVLVISDENQKRRITFGELPKDGAGLELYDESGKVIWRAQ
jgi:hypothetical protein